MRGVKYIGPFFDRSGYAEAARNYVLALHRAGVSLTLHPHCFENDAPEVCTAADREVINSLVNKDIDFDTVVVHLTPDHFPMYAKMFPNKRIIGYTVWETSKLHPKWVADCNAASEILVPCQWNVDVFKASGVTVPVYKVHHGIDTSLYGNPVSAAEKKSAGMREDVFNFLSIMQWNFRKNPEALLRTYFNAFPNGESVRLTLKAYIGKGQSPQKETGEIKTIVARIKSDMNLPSYPAVSLITKPLPTEQLQLLYAACDAYVSLSHAEGFGLTSFGAGLAGKPVIMTGATGNMEYMTEANSYPVPSELDYVYGMSSFNPWYLGDQQWYRPNLPAAASLMREVYTERAAAKNRGHKLRTDIINNFSWAKVAEQFIERLEA